MAAVGIPYLLQIDSSYDADEALQNHNIQLQICNNK